MMPYTMCNVYAIWILSHYITTINVKKKISCCVALNHVCIFYDCSYITDWVKNKLTSIEGIREESN